MEHRHACASSANHQEDRTDELCCGHPEQLISDRNDGERYARLDVARPTASPKVMRDPGLLAALARAIKMRRLARRITQDELAHATGLDRSYVVSIEQGRRNISITKLAQIAAELRLPASQLLRLAEEQVDNCNGDG